MRFGKNSNEAVVRLSWVTHIPLKAKYDPNAGQRANPERTDMDNQLQGRSLKKQVTTGWSQESRV